MLCELVFSLLCARITYRSTLNPPWYCLHTPLPYHTSAPPSLPFPFWPCPHALPSSCVLCGQHQLLLPSPPSPQVCPVSCVGNLRSSPPLTCCPGPVWHVGRAVGWRPRPGRSCHWPTPGPAAAAPSPRPCHPALHTHINTHIVRSEDSSRWKVQWKACTRRLSLHVYISIYTYLYTYKSISRYTSPCMHVCIWRV